MPPFVAWAFYGGGATDLSLKGFGPFAARPFYVGRSTDLSLKGIRFIVAKRKGYWHQRADERHGNPPQGNQELLVVRDKVGRPPGELGGKQVHGM